LDCQSQAAGAPLQFAGFPSGLRAAQLPGVRPESKGKRRADPSSLFLETFGKPPRLLASDTERSCECNIPQAFQLVSGSTLDTLLVRKDNRIGRLLEHSRIFRFENDGVPEVFIGSADLRPRNLRRRVELLVPVVDRDHQRQLDGILDLYMSDPTGWDLTSTGEYIPRPGKAPGAQETLIARLENVESNSAEERVAG